MSGSTCGLVLAWIGPCKAATPCPIHAESRCCSCDKPATRECAETTGAFVCGSYLCDGCDHDYRAGTLGPRFAHSPRRGRLP